MDRVIATSMGAYATKIIMEGKSNRVICYKNNRVTDFDIEEGLSMEKDLDKELYNVSKMVSH